jgi:hypothetical protein
VAILGLVALLSLVLSPAPADALSFPDVNSNDWFAEAVQVLADEGVVQTNADGTFGPYDTIDRAEFSALLSTALDLPPGGTHPFTDFPAGSWFEPAVAALFEAGLASGVSPTAFDPEGKISRQQAVSLIMRALRYRLTSQPVAGLNLALAESEVETWLRVFADQAHVAATHRMAVANAYRLQIVQGRPDGRFGPLDEVTRAQTVGMLYAALFKTPAALTSRPASSAAPPVTAPAAYPDATSGSHGSHVVWLEQRLADLTYRPGPVDGVFDHRTYQAVIAFQKWEGLTRDGVVRSATWARLATATSPVPRQSGSGIWIEVNTTKQVFLYVENGTVTRTLPTSTGRSFTYRTSPYTVQRKAIADGPRYRALYLNPGNVLAIHGYPSVPVYPASDGCIRLPKWDMDDLRARDPYDQMIPDGTMVYVY